MAVKIYFKDNIHRLTKLPENLTTLIAQISSLLKNELTSSFKIRYLDSEGDYINVSHEHDFKELLELEKATPESTLKLYIVQDDSVSNSNGDNSQNQPAKYPSLEEYKAGDKEEKPVNAGFGTDSQAASKLNDKSSEKESKMQFKKAKELMKMIAKGKYPDTEDQILRELNAIKETLTEEQRQKLEEKSRKCGEKYTKKKEKATKEHREKRLEKDSKNSFKVIEFLRTFKKFIRAQNKEKVDKAAKLREKLSKMIPEQRKQTLEAILASLPKDLEKDIMRKRLTDETRSLVEACFPEEKEKILQELETFLEEKRKKREQREQSKGNHEKNWDKEKAALKEKYSKNVFRRAKALKLIFPQEEIAKLCEYISQKPLETSMEDLVINYRNDVKNL